MPGRRKPSSISSFDAAMRPLVKNAGATLIALLAMYEAALRVTAPDVEQGADQLATNTIVLENYFDQPERPNTVIVGSSLTERLPFRSKRQWTNLSLAGGGPLTGLEIIAASRKWPKRVMIEINFADKGDDPELFRKITKWPWPELRSSFWSYRTAYMPMNLLTDRLRLIVRKNGPELDPIADDIPLPNFLSLLKIQKDSYERVPNAEALAANISRMKEVVYTLQSKGSAIIFFEMPVDHSLTLMPRSRAIRAAMERVFNPQNYCWLLLDRGERWRTADGLHLLPQSAERTGYALAHYECMGP
jgi:hypothetical protein